MRRVEQVDAAVVEHRAPARGRRLHPESEKTQRRLGEDGAAHPEGRLHAHGRQRRGNHVTKEHAGRSGPERARRLHELELTRPQHLTAYQPRVAHPADERQRDHDVGQARAQHRHHRDGEQQPRKRQQDVDDATQSFVHAAAEVPGDGADQDPHGRRDRHHHQADQQRDARAREHPRQNVPTELVETEPVPQRRPGEPEREVLRGGVEGCDDRSDHRGEHRNPHDDCSDAGHPDGGRRSESGHARRRLARHSKRILGSSTP